MSLAHLFTDHIGKATDKWSLYIDVYDELFQAFKEKPITLLEIGVENGGSLEIWSKYFAKGQLFVGCDINEKCAVLKFDDPRIKLIVGDANSFITEQLIHQVCCQFDIIIDDGSHTSDDIVKSFAKYFPLLKEDGLFIIEDLHCSYWDVYQGGLFNEASSISFFKRLTDVVNAQHWRVNFPITSILADFYDKYGVVLTTEELESIHSVSFWNSLCLIRKKSAKNNLLGKRIVTGKIFNVTDASFYREVLLDDLKDYSKIIYHEESTLKSFQKDILIKALYEKNQRLETQQKNHEYEQQTLKNSMGDLATKNQQLEVRIATFIDSTFSFKKILFKIKNKIYFYFKKIIKKSLKLAKNIVKRIVSSHVYDKIRLKFFYYGYLIYKKYLRNNRYAMRLRSWVMAKGVTLAYVKGITPSLCNVVENLNANIDNTLKNNGMTAKKYIPNCIPWFKPLNIEVDPSLSANPRMNVLIPTLRMNALSAGPNVAIMIAMKLAKSQNIRIISTCSPLENDLEPLRKHICLLTGLSYQEVLATEIVDASDRSIPLTIGKNDLFVATAWWTAQMVKYAIKETNYSTFIYVIQDYEPILHAASSSQMLASETYHLDYIPIICASALFNHFVENQVGQFKNKDFLKRAQFFEPAVSSDIFFPIDKSHSKEKKHQLLFYTRPNHPRNLFEIGLAAIQNLVHDGKIIADHWEINGMGEYFEPIHLGNGVYLKAVPWKDFASYGKQMQEADLLLSLMLSPHPSFPPLEMAACGGLVVTNTCGGKSKEYLQKLSSNILAAEPIFEDIADKLSEAVTLIESQSPRSLDRPQLPSTWDESFKLVIPTLEGYIHDIRKHPHYDNTFKGPLLHNDLAGDYGQMRRERLNIRRELYIAPIQSGLLSFITCVWNTDASYIECLANSLFNQDGGAIFEWIILDNGSSNENTRAMLKRLQYHPSVKLYRVEDNIGIIGGMRYCLEKATGEYILPLDSDDYLYPDCVRVISSFIQWHNYPALLYTDEDKLTQDNLFIYPYSKPSWDPVLFANSCYIAHLCVIKRSLALELNLYTDSSVEGCHDWDTFTRFYQAGYTPRHIPEILYSWRMHPQSTSLNFRAKNFIFDSHQSVLKKLVSGKIYSDSYDVTLSPLFNQTPDWWIRRIKPLPTKIQKIMWGNTDVNSIDALYKIIEKLPHDIEYIHLLSSQVLLEHEEWNDDWLNYFELYPDTVMVGGRFHDGEKIKMAGCYLGFDWGAGCPDVDRILNDPGYFAQLWKPHSVSAVSSLSMLIEKRFLQSAMQMIKQYPITLTWLGCWLGAEAKRLKKRVVYTPYMIGNIQGEIALEPSLLEARWFRFHNQDLFPDKDFMSPHLSLNMRYTEISEQKIIDHLHYLRSDIPEYSAIFEMVIKQRKDKFAPKKDISFSILTTLYKGTDASLFSETWQSVKQLKWKNFEWILLAHGPISKNLELFLETEKLAECNAVLLRLSENVGIVKGMAMCLKHATKEYIVPLDSDDLITDDALNILGKYIEENDYPEYLYSDEDLIQDNVLMAPYLRPDWDPLLNATNSYVWHLTVFSRAKANELNIYSDSSVDYCHDWDTITRFHDAGYRILHVPHVLYHWRIHKQSISNAGSINNNSLISTLNHLNRCISKMKDPENYKVEEFPVFRGAKEYTMTYQNNDKLKSIAYLVKDHVYLKQKKNYFLMPNNINELAEQTKKLQDIHYCYIVFLANTFIFADTDWLNEAMRCFETDNRIVIVSGRVLDAQKNVYSSGYAFDSIGGLTEFQNGMNEMQGGYYTVQLKPQTIFSPNKEFFISETEFLLNALSNKPSCINLENFWVWLGVYALEAKKYIVYSPLVQANIAKGVCGHSKMINEEINQFIYSLNKNKIPRYSHLYYRQPA